MEQTEHKLYIIWYKIKMVMSAQDMIIILRLKLVILLTFPHYKNILIENVFTENKYKCINYLRFVVE